MQAQVIEAESDRTSVDHNVIPNAMGLVRILERYNVQEDGEVREFLAAHPYLIDLLLAAVRPVGALFGVGTPVKLQVLVDHEGDDDAVLKAFIETREAIKGALEKRRCFQRDWWARVKSIARRRLRFDVDCLEAD